MKHILKFSVFLLAVIICFSSCESGDSSGNPGTDSTFIYRMKIIHDVGPGQETSDIYFHYDAQKRMVAFSHYGDNGSGSIAQLDTNIFYYQGSSINPYKFTNALVTGGVAGAIITEHHFSYDAQNRKIFDSAIVSGTPNRAIRFTYEGNRVYAESRHITGVPATVVYRWDTATLKTNGDLLNIKTYGLQAGVSVQTGQATYTYDNFNSPFAKSAFYHTVWGFPYDGEYELDYVGRSNILTSVITTFAPLATNYSLNATHEYNAAGYSTKTTTQDGGGTDEYYFYYKAL